MSASAPSPDPTRTRSTTIRKRGRVRVTPGHFFLFFLRTEPGRTRGRFPGPAEGSTVTPESADPTLKGTPAAELLPAVYAELRRLAAALSTRLPPGQTL